MNDDLKQGALALGRMGMRIFPCRPNDKRPLWQGWQQTATDDETQIAEIWSQQPECNVGLDCTTLAVIDLDTHGGDDGADGIETLASWEIENGVTLPRTVVTETPTGGRHLWFANPDGLDIRNSTNAALAVDVRAAGGFVVAPPSRHPNGGVYRFAPGCSPDEIEIAPIDDVVLSFLAFVQRKEPKGKGDHRGGVIPAGQRNDTLFKLACGLRGRGASEGVITERLREANATRCTPPLDESEVRTIAASAAGYAPDPDAADLAPLVAVMEACDLQHESLNDAVLSTIFALAFEGVLCFVCDGGNAGEWRRFDGRRWTPEGGRGYAQRCCKAFSRALLDYLDTLPQVSPPMMAAALRYQSERSRSALLRDAESELTVSASKFDAVPNVLNVKNGTLFFDLQRHSVSFKEHRPDDYISRLAPVTFDPEIENHLFEDTLKAATSGDCEYFDFMLELFAVVCSGDCSHDIFLMAGTKSRSGKSTIWGAIADTLGSGRGGYASSIDPAALAYNRFRNAAAASPDRAALFGKRLCVGSEPPEKMSLDASLLKQVTGGDMVQVRRLYAEPTSARMDGLVCLLCNRYPELSDPACFSRILCLPFDNQIPEDARDLTLRDRLREPAEKSAILNAAIEGFHLLHDGVPEGESARLEIPETVREETERYRRRCDPLQVFIDDACTERPGAVTPAKVLFEAHLAQCAAVGARPLPKGDFYHRLRDREFWRDSATVAGKTIRNCVEGIVPNGGDAAE